MDAEKKLEQIEMLFREMSGKLEECIFKEEYETASVLEPFVLKYREISPLDRGKLL